MAECQSPDSLKEFRDYAVIKIRADDISLSLSLYTVIVKNVV